LNSEKAKMRKYEVELNRMKLSFTIIDLGGSNISAKAKSCSYRSEAVLTALHFLRKLQIGPLS
jgi:hypothetical protein